MSAARYAFPTLFILSGLALGAQDTVVPAPQNSPQYAPLIAEASDEGRETMARFELPEGFVVELVAAEPHLANPVCFIPARDGSFYVSETFRLHAGVTDMREHVERLEEDMACNSVADRVAMFKRWAGADFEKLYGSEHERIRLLRDTDGDGVVDWSTVYADGFKDAASGIAAGLLEHEGSIYYTCIPSLWKLRDGDGDGRAEERTSLSRGYGVRVTLLGHDLHGLQIGPDGWLYFSCGDRGFNVETKKGRIVHPDTGAVLRCRLDGSDLEVFHTGLRNPQELAFDKYGNLFTGDNNSDGGDRARLVQIVEGADSGWRSSYQWISEPVSRGPWNAEQLWLPHFEGQAAYLLPPIANLADGPSGLAYYPGTGLSIEYDGTFLLCDFRGQASISGIHAFKVQPKGAGFELIDPRKFVWQTLVTDVDFGPDGSIYFTDWVHGWNMTGKGRLYRTYDPKLRAAPEVKKVQDLLTQGVHGRELDELAVLLRHSDMRVRQLAQFEFVGRKREGWERLQQVLKQNDSELASLHAIWGLGMAADEEAGMLEYLHPFLRDTNPRIRAQVARVLGDHRYAPAGAHLIEALRDESATVRRFAAIACGRLGDVRAVGPLLELSRRFGAMDPVLRHAANYGLRGSARVEDLLAVREDADVNARLAAVVALRSQGAVEVAAFLADASPLVVLEAARAINDVPLAGAFEDLAATLESVESGDEAFLRRALNANLRHGCGECARRLARFTLREEMPERLRADALRMLAKWHQPAPRDYVISNWRPLGPRDTPSNDIAMIGADLATRGLLAGPDSVLRAWIEIVRAYPPRNPAHLLAEIVRNREREGATRREALALLEERGDAEFESLLRGCLDDGDSTLRAAALEALPRIDFAEALPLFEAVLASGGIEERRAVYAALSRVADRAAERMLLAEFAKLEAGALPAELRLDVMEALAERESSVARQAVEGLRATRRAQDPVLGEWTDTYFGGDARKGRRIFEENEALTCLRCHLTGQDASRGVGPDLSGVGTRLTRDQLVQAIVAPNARIAPGFEAVLLVLEDEAILAGRVLDEGPQRLTILQSDGVPVEVEVARILERRPDLSAMPEGMGQFLTRRQMRDLVEYLASR
jgi:quinoprotein glucose dehydrogenase